MLAARADNYVSMEPGSHRRGSAMVGRTTGGTSNCMVAKDGAPTMFASIVEWQRSLARAHIGPTHRHAPKFDLERVSIFSEAAAFHLRSGGKAVAG